MPPLARPKVLNLGTVKTNIIVVVVVSDAPTQNTKIVVIEIQKGTLSNTRTIEAHHNSLFKM